MECIQRLEYVNAAKVDAVFQCEGNKIHCPHNHILVIQWTICWAVCIRELVAQAQEAHVCIIYICTQG